MTEWRPCGACGALVPADTGCEHWRPGMAAASAVRAARAARANEKTGRQRRTERARARAADVEEARQRRLASEAVITQRRRDRKAARVRAQEAATARLKLREEGKPAPGWHHPTPGQEATDQAMAQLHRMMTMGRRMTRMGEL